MRQIVYNNIMKLIKLNTVDAEKTKTGIKYVLRGKDDAEIFSLYSNTHKIELYIDNKLFASAPRTHTTMYDQNYEHYRQLWYIKRMMDDMCGLRKMLSLSPYIQNHSVKHRNHFGATPTQTKALQKAWYKSWVVNHEMCGALGHSR